MTRRKDDDGRLTLDLIRDNMWKDVNCLPEQILEDIEAKGFKATLSAVQSTRSGFIANLTWLAKQGVYTARLFSKPRYQRSICAKRRWQPRLSESAPMPLSSKLRDVRTLLADVAKFHERIVP
jgi:hypothetical protein